MAVQTRKLTPSRRMLGSGSRRFERVSAPPMVVRNGDAVVADISEGGVCLQFRHTPDPRGAYYVTLTDGLFYLGCDLRAEVRWARGNRAGLEWTNLNGEARAFLRKCFERWTEERIPIWVELYGS